MAAERRYDKGERRFKHVGHGFEPKIEFDDGNPRKLVGKCPSNLGGDELAALLNTAIPGPNGERDLAAPKRLYAVHDGTIYEAQTSDGGTTYHGYPYRGRLSRDLHDRLAQMADELDCGAKFRKWVKAHITLLGSKK
jgi:hypothetical protein